MSIFKSLFCGYSSTTVDPEDYAEAKRILSKNLFSISPLNKSITRDILSLAYTPGVG